MFRDVLNFRQFLQCSRSLSSDTLALGPCEKLSRRSDNGAVGKVGLTEKGKGKMFQQMGHKSCTIC